MTHPGNGILDTHIQRPTTSAPHRSKRTITMQFSPTAAVL